MGLRSLIGKVGAVIGRIGRGDVLHSRDMRIDRGLTVLRFNVNRDPATGEIFVVMGLLGGGSQNWSMLDADEVDELANMTRATQIAVRAERARSGLP